MSKKVTTILATLLIGILGFLGTWVFNSVAAMDAKFQTIEAAERKEGALSERLTRIENKIDDVYWLVLTNANPPRGGR